MEFQVDADRGSNRVRSLSLEVERGRPREAKTGESNQMASHKPGLLSTNGMGDVKENIRLQTLGRKKDGQKVRDKS